MPTQNKTHSVGNELATAGLIDLTVFWAMTAGYMVSDYIVDNFSDESEPAIVENIATPQSPKNLTPNN